MERKTSQHVVRVFDPNRNPIVAEMLKAEQAKDLKVKAISCYSRPGMVKTPAGTFCLDAEGVGDSKPLEQECYEALFFRSFSNEDGTTEHEVIPFVSAFYSLAECFACLTGEELTLDLFIGHGRRKDANFEAWQKALS